MCVSGTLFTFSCIISYFKTQIHSHTKVVLMNISLLDLAHTVSEREKLSFLHTWTVFQKSRSCVQSHFEFLIEKIENFFIGQRWRPAGGGSANSKQQGLSLLLFFLNIM